MTFLDCWRTSFCVTTIIKIVTNSTNDKPTFGASLALDEDSPYTNSCLFTLDRLPLLLLFRKNYFSSSQKTSLQSVRKPYFPLLVFNSPWVYWTIKSNILCIRFVFLYQHFLVSLVHYRSLIILCYIFWFPLYIIGV